MRARLQIIFESEQELREFCNAYNTGAWDMDYEPPRHNPSSAVEQMAEIDEEVEREAEAMHEAGLTALPSFLNGYKRLPQDIHFNSKLLRIMHARHGGTWEEFVEEELDNLANSGVVNSWARGRGKPSIESLQKLAVASGVSVQRWVTEVNDD